MKIFIDTSVWIALESKWVIFERFNKDKFWSFTDCTSKAIMEMLDIDESFSFDKNFEQMGFIRRP